MVVTGFFKFFVREDPAFPLSMSRTKDRVAFRRPGDNGEWREGTVIKVRVAANGPSPFCVRVRFDDGEVKELYPAGFAQDAHALVIFPQAQELLRTDVHGRIRRLAASLKVLIARDLLDMNSDDTDPHYQLVDPQNNYGRVYVENAVITLQYLVFEHGNVRLGQNSAATPQPGRYCSLAGSQGGAKRFLTIDQPAS
jgi:hypothetical protein